MNITGAQIRAARGFLGWSRRELADRADVGLSTVQGIEGAGTAAPVASPNGVETTFAHRAAAREASLKKIIAALIKGGCTFLPDDRKAGPGVRCREKK